MNKELIYYNKGLIEKGYIIDMVCANALEEPFYELKKRMTGKHKCFWIKFYQKKHRKRLHIVNYTYKGDVDINLDGKLYKTIKFSKDVLNSV